MSRHSMVVPAIIVALLMAATMIFCLYPAGSDDRPELALEAGHPAACLTPNGVQKGTACFSGVGGRDGNSGDI